MSTSSIQAKAKSARSHKSPLKATNRQRIVKPAPKPTTSAVKVSTAPFVTATGRRKTAVARVRLQVSAAPEIIVNGKKLADYFPAVELQDTVKSPLVVCGKDQETSVSVKVSGGGVHGQVEAVRHGISRALLVLDAKLRPTLKPHGFLTRDPRMKERKKPGLKRARRAPQWQKR